VGGVFDKRRFVVNGSRSRTPTCPLEGDGWGSMDSGGVWGVAGTKRGSGGSRRWGVEGGGGGGVGGGGV